MTTWLEHLTVDECRQHLRDAVLGRISVMVDGHPEIFPVNHVFDEETGAVTFPSNPRTKLHAALDWPFIAFEVDGMDDSQRRGWSVLVVGKAEEITDVSRLHCLAEQRTVRWTPSPERWLEIVPSKISGRRISYSLG